MELTLIVMLRWHTIFPRFMKIKSRMNVQIVVDFSQLIHQFQWWKWMWYDTCIHVEILVEIRSLLVELKEFSIAHCVQKDFSKNPTSNFTLKGMYFLTKVIDKIAAYLVSRKIITYQIFATNFSINQFLSISFDLFYAIR